MKKIVRYFVTPLVICFLIAMIAGVSGCKQKEGPMERTGKEIDQSIEKAGQKIEKEQEGRMERKGKEIDHGAEKAGQKIDKVIEKTGEKVEKSGEKIKNSVK